MSDNQDVLLPLQLHDDRFQPDHHVSITFSTSISVVEFVFVARFVVLRVFLLQQLVNLTYMKGLMFTHLYLFIGHTVTYTRIQLIKRFPRLLLEREERACLLCPLQC